jgi:hypothetical protein
VHRAVRHLSAYAEPAPWATVGQVLDASLGAQSAQATAGVVITPTGRQLPVEDEGGEVLELTEQGFYELRTRGGEGVAAVVASNVDSAESDLTPMDPKEIVAATVGGPGEGSRAAGTPPPPDAQERSQRLWWYLLCIGILVLGADTLISNRLSKS